MIQRSLSVFVLLSVFLSLHSPACGPEFPNAYLTYGAESEILSMPEASFYHELSVVLGQAPEIDAFWYPVEEDAWKNTLTADTTDLRDALTAGGMAAQDLESLLTEYSAMRVEMNKLSPLPFAAPNAEVGDEYVETYTDESAADASVDPAAQEESTPDFDVAAYEALLARLPAEFSLYLRGAAAYRLMDFPKAMEHWKSLLALPEAERQFRSVWAAYMLGKALMIQSDYSGAIASFQQVRDLVAAGYRDSLGMAPESLGWQANAESTLGDTVSAIHHYADMFLNGPVAVRNVGYVSLRWECARALDKPEEHAKLAADPLCRRVMTAWAVANSYSNPSPRWLEQVASLNLPGPVESGDRLAWAAYDNGDMESAKRWLDLADPQSPYTKWVRSKLLFREGKIDEGLALLRDVSASFPNKERWTIGYSPEAAPRDIANAELGVLLLGRQDYVNALDCLMRSGFWMDAAYVAERVLTVEELEAYVTAHAKDEALALPLSPDQYWEEEGWSRLDSLKALLGRRFARAGQWDKAIEYSPEALKPVAQEVKTHLAAANAPVPAPGITESISTFFSGLWGSAPEKPVDRPRAEAFYAAAELVRSQGLDLMGTEVEPDWFLFGGSFELEGATFARASAAQEDAPTEPAPMEDASSINPNLVAALAASQDEKERVARHAPEPNIRFHYRYTAADLMWQSAAWLPDNDPATVRALYWGGSYLQNRDPQAADKFYKALVWRNLNMPYAREANKKRWFPSTPPE